MTTTSLAATPASAVSPADTTQLSTAELLALHLGPGALMTVGFVLFAPVIEAFGFPPLAALLTAIVLILAPTELGVLWWAARREGAWPRGTYLIGREADPQFRTGSSGTRTAKQRDPRAKGWLVPSPEASQPLAAVVPGAPRSPGKEGLDRAGPAVRWSVEPACPGTAA